MLPRSIIEETRRIEIITRRLVNDQLAGRYHSVFKGQGMDFNEVRQYQMGDDIRLIDWNVTARIGEVFIKNFVEERELTVFLLVDTSPSLNFGTRTRTKSDLATRVAALFAFSAIKNNDRVGLALFSDRIERFIPPMKGRKHVLRVISEVISHQAGAGAGVGAGAGAVAMESTRAHVQADFQGHTGNNTAGATSNLVRGGGEQSTGADQRDRAGKAGQTDLTHALEFLSRITKRRAVAIVISDFPDHSPQLERALDLANRRHDLICLRVTDPFEENLPDLGGHYLEVEDPETGEMATIDTSPRFRKAYNRQREEHGRKLNEIFRKLKVDHIHLSTDKPYTEPLVELFKNRARRQSRG